MTEFLREQLISLNPIDIASYLHSLGWQRIDEIDSKASYWKIKIDEKEEYEILLPQDKRMRDFAQRMADLIKTLEIIEKRPTPLIVNDFITSGSDLLRFRIGSSETERGTIPLTQATSLAKGVEDLLMSAACAIVEPNHPYYPKKNFLEVRKYIEGCRMGQSEKGSYILTVLSPVAPMLQGSIFPEFDEEVFSRKVVLKLIESLTMLNEALMIGKSETLEAVVEYGVSANLCEALELMRPHSDNGALDIGVTWSRNRPMSNKNAPQSVRLDAHIFPLLHESARYLRRNAPRENFELIGKVIKLDTSKPNKDSEGKVTIATIVDDRTAHVVMELQKADYKEAIKAHEQKSLFYCRGDLVKLGKGYSLQKPREIKVVQEIIETVDE